MRPSKSRMRDHSSGGSTTDTESDSDKEFLNPSDSGPFSEGEKVLACHSNHIYAAKVMKVEYHVKEWKYKVHYLGWNKSWDEWVGVEHLMKFTEENVRKQKELQEKDKDKGTKPGRGTLVKPKTFGEKEVCRWFHIRSQRDKRKAAIMRTRGKKRKNGSVTKEKGHMPLGKHMNIHIPLTLKKQLVDDCESITHQGKFIKLPRTPNVDDILKKYHDYRLKKDGSTSDLVGELSEGLHSYFNKTLPVFLLYKSERRQYEEGISNNVSPSSVYGAEHFLRLFVKLPELLDNAQIEKETLMEMLPMLNDFLNFLQKNQSTFFLSAYGENTAGMDKYD